MEHYSEERVTEVAKLMGRLYNPDDPYVADDREEPAHG